MLITKFESCGQFFSLPSFIWIGKMTSSSFRLLSCFLISVGTTVSFNFLSDDPESIDRKYNTSAGIFMVNRTPEEIETTLKKHEIIPDVIKTAPKNVLQVTYFPTPIELGNQMSPRETDIEPALLYWPTEGDSHYTLIMTAKIYWIQQIFGETLPKSNQFLKLIRKHLQCNKIDGRSDVACHLATQRLLYLNLLNESNVPDARAPPGFDLLNPDVPNRTTHFHREWQNWVVVNIPGCDIMEGETLTHYIPPLPEEQFGGLQRFIFLAYKQPRLDMFFNETHVGEKDATYGLRGNFSTERFAKKYRLGNPVAANFFFLKWELLNF